MFCLIHRHPPVKINSAFYRIYIITESSYISYYEKLPNGWAVCSVGDVAFFERGITFPASAKEFLHTESNIACIRTANVQETIEVNDLLYISKNFLKNNKDKFLRIGDIVMSTANSRELVGKSTIVEQLNQPMTFGGFVMVIRSKGVNPNYLLLYLRNKFLQGTFAIRSTQTTNIANIRVDDVANLQLYLPPRAEQDKIILKYQELQKIFFNIEKSFN